VTQPRKRTFEPAGKLGREDKKTRVLARGPLLMVVMETYYMRIIEIPCYDLMRFFVK